MSVELTIPEIKNERIEAVIHMQLSASQAVLGRMRFTLHATR